MNKTLCIAALSAVTVLGGTAASAQEGSPPSEQPPAQPHTVLAGESLSTISEAALGTPDRWVEIFALNLDTVANPDIIGVGQVLDIPLSPVAIPVDLFARVAPAPAPAPANQSVTTGGDDPAPSQAVASVGDGDGNLAAIRACESGGDYGAVSSDGQYGGAYQFDRQTWQSVGGSGDPAAASPAEQDARAGQLLSERGSNPWPNCG
ncbi:MAG: transglycosylase family protein [Actinobacteria bacterium]|nr:transglycosylase family protein [Actinomycetota bacterium]